MNIEPGKIYIVSSDKDYVNIWAFVEVKSFFNFSNGSVDVYVTFLSGPLKGQVCYVGRHLYTWTPSSYEELVAYVLES